MLFSGNMSSFVFTDFLHQAETSFALDEEFIRFPLLALVTVPPLQRLIHTAAAEPVVSMTLCIGGTVTRGQRGNLMNSSPCLGLCCPSARHAAI